MRPLPSRIHLLAATLVAVAGSAVAAPVLLPVSASPALLPAAIAPSGAPVDATTRDMDGDGVPDAEDGDVDGDGVPNDRDNCLLVPNGTQNDRDGDGVGDLCDADIDGDGIANWDDRFPTDARTEATILTEGERFEATLQEALSRIPGATMIATKAASGVELGDVMRTQPASRHLGLDAATLPDAETTTTLARRVEPRAARTVAAAPPKAKPIGVLGPSWRIVTPEAPSGVDRFLMGVRRGVSGAWTSIKELPSRIAE